MFNWIVVVISLLLMLNHSYVCVSPTYTGLNTTTISAGLQQTLTISCPLNFVNSDVSFTSCTVDSLYGSSYTIKYCTSPSVLSTCVSTYTQTGVCSSSQSNLQFSSAQFVYIKMNCDNSYYDCIFKFSYSSHCVSGVGTLSPTTPSTTGPTSLAPNTMIPTTVVPTTVVPTPNTNILPLCSAGDKSTASSVSSSCISNNYDALNSGLGYFGTYNCKNGNILTCIGSVCPNSNCNSYCSSYSNCFTCNQDLNCGWCGATQTCFFGNGYQPTSGTCASNYFVNSNLCPTTLAPTTSNPTSAFGPTSSPITSSPTTSVPTTSNPVVITFSPTSSPTSPSSWPNRCATSCADLSANFCTASNTNTYSCLGSGVGGCTCKNGATWSQTGYDNCGHTGTVCGPSTSGAIQNSIIIAIVLILLASAIMV